MALTRRRRIHSRWARRFPAAETPAARFSCKSENQSKLNARAAPRAETGATLMLVESLWFEVGLIFFLILANGFFAAAEIAIIATRKTRIDTLLEGGARSAAAVARLKD